MLLARHRAEVNMSSSRITGGLGQAVSVACEALLSTLKDRLQEKSGRDLSRSSVRLTKSSQEIHVVTDGMSKPVRDLFCADLGDAEELTAEGSFFGPVQSVNPDLVLAGTPIDDEDLAAYVHIALVRVDPETGDVRVVKYHAMHDVGAAIDRDGIRAQIEGGVVMGLGTALTEEILWNPASRSAISSYVVPRIGDRPGELTVDIVEGFAGTGVRGSKGIGEHSMIPVAAAVGNAVSSAASVRLYRLPMTPWSVSEAIHRPG